MKAPILRPQKEKLVLAKVPKDLFINPISLEDDEWLEENIGSEPFKEAFKKVDMDVLLKFLWQVLDDESKEYVVNIKLLKWEAEKKVPATYDEPYKKLKALVCGGKEILEVYRALTVARQKSNPEPGDTQKKSQPVEPHSPSSSATTSLPQSTEQPQPNSTE